MIACLKVKYCWKNEKQSKVIKMKEKMPEAKTTLANRAIHAWKNAEGERKERHLIQTVKFAEEAKKKFEWDFKNEELSITSTKEIDPSTAEIVCEDVTFVAQRKEGGIVFLVEAKCQYCGKRFLPEYANNVIDIVGIGARLSVSQTCEKCLENMGRTVRGVQSTRELVIEKVREIYDLIKEE